VPFGGGGSYNMNENKKKTSKYGRKLRVAECESVFWRPWKFEGKK
jgi:hypothetical protein